MDQLFKHREGSWVEVFEHLLSMTDSSLLTQELISQHLQEIQHWVDEGVENLFQLREDQQLLITELNGRIISIEAEINFKRHELETLHKMPHGTNVIDIGRPRKLRELQDLVGDREQLLEERTGKEQLIELLDENIQEFEEKLSQTRRDYLIHAV